MWIRPEVKPNVFYYQEYTLCYVDDVICISADPGKSTKRIQDSFKHKYDNIAEPDMYLGATLYNISLEKGMMLDDVI